MQSRLGVWVMVLIVAGVVNSGAAAPVTIEPGILWPDAAGTHINAHCGDIIKVGDNYYWFGEFRNGRGVQNISCYASKDLSHWTFDKQVITPKTHADVLISHMERPKVIYNATTKKFVMWVHREKTMGYAAAECAVADCDTVDGDYQWQGHFRPNGNMSRDSTLFEDDDGTAYFISSSNENADLIMYKLSSDYLKVDSQVLTLFPGQYREAPCVFKRNGIYYLVNSFCTGTYPNTQFYSMATKMSGPWSPYRRLAGTDTWNTYCSQAAFVLPVKGTQTTSFLYCADRWQVMPMRHVWLPLEFAADGSIAPMHWADSWTLDAETGAVQVPQESKLAESDLAKIVKVSSDYNHRGSMDFRNYTHLAGCQPENGNDGDPTTFWCANDNLPGHWWKVDLGSVNDISGAQISWHRKNHAYKYRIETSTDDTSWSVAADRTERTNPQPNGMETFTASHVRYVRIVITGIPSGYDWPSFDEFKVFSASNDIALGKPATADSWQPNTDATKAIDGDETTAWTVDDHMNGHWLKADLGESMDVGGTQFMWDSPGYPYQYVIETSADDKNWTIGTDQSRNTQVMRMPTDRFFASGVRYVRLTITGYDRGCWPGVREFRVLKRSADATAH